MRGFECVGRIGPDGMFWLTRVVPGDALLRYATPTGSLRDGNDRARDVQDRHMCYSTCASLAVGDNVLLATALGEHAFDPAPSTAAQ